MYGISCKILLYIILVRSLWQIFKLGRNVHSKCNVRHIILFLKKFSNMTRNAYFMKYFLIWLGLLWLQWFLFKLEWFCLHLMRFSARTLLVKSIRLSSVIPWCQSYFSPYLFIKWIYFAQICYYGLYLLICYEFKFKNISKSFWAYKKKSKFCFYVTSVNIFCFALNLITKLRM